MKIKNKYNQTSETILFKAKQIILRLEPNAEIYLYGSRARGDFKMDSDWDLLILIPGKAVYDRKRKIIHQLNDLEIEFRIVFNIIIIEKSDWYGNPMINSGYFN